MLNSHRECFICGPENPHGLAVRFLPHGSGVQAEYTVPSAYQGYPGVVQGGIVSALLDSAMTNCLGAQGVEAMTARLEVRFHHPVKTGTPLRVEADWEGGRGKIYRLTAVIEQEKQIKASASGVFLKSRPAEKTLQ